MKPRALRIGLAVLLTVSRGLAWWFRNQWTAEAIVAWVEGFGVWGPLVHDAGGPGVCLSRLCGARSCQWGARSGAHWGSGSDPAGGGGPPARPHPPLAPQR